METVNRLKQHLPMSCSLQSMLQYKSTNAPTLNGPVSLAPNVREIVHTNLLESFLDPCEMEAQFCKECLLLV